MIQKSNNKMVHRITVHYYSLSEHKSTFLLMNQKPTPKTDSCMTEYQLNQTRYLNASLLEHSVQDS